MTPSIPLKASSPIAVTLALAFLTLSTPPPAAAQADYALRQIVATGGHQVQGVGDGVILTQEYAEDCRLAADASEPDDRPIAATVSTAVALDVSVMSCLRDPAEPAVHCSWRIRGPEAAEPGKKEGSWTGWEGSIPIAVPDKTGVYTLALTCEIQGSDETVERTAAVFEDQEAVMCIVSTGGYGGWYFYSYTPHTGVGSCSKDTRESAAFTGSVDFSVVDQDEEKLLIEELVVDVEVEILTGGEYVVQGALFSGEKLIAHRQSWETKRFAAERLSGDPGQYNVRLHFSGEEIYRSQIHGPYLFRASISSERGVADTLTAKTPPYRFFFFGEESSEILKVETEGIDLDGDGLYEAMVATVELKVRRPGLFVLEARLAQEGRTIAEVAKRVPLLPGKRPRTVKLRFPGKLIARKGLRGPYELTVHHLGEGFSSIGSHLVTLRDLKAAEFE